VNGNIQQVSMITAKTIFTVDAEQGLEHKASERSLEKVEPVPLTNEVLKQCGFLYHDYFKFWQLVTTGIRSEMDISPDFEVIDFMRKPIIKKLTSLHQLQNVYFMLKGRELKLNRNMMALA